MDINDINMAVQTVSRKIKDPNSEVAKALSGTYVRFEDENGNPLASRSVVIKVSAATGEIIDIISEA